MINSLKKLKESCDNEVNDSINKAYMKYMMKLESAFSLIKDGVIPDDAVVESEDDFGFNGTYAELKDKLITLDLLEEKIQYVIDLLYSNLPIEVLEKCNPCIKIDFNKIYYRYDLLNLEDKILNISKVEELYGKNYRGNFFTNCYEVSISIYSSDNDFKIPILLDNHFILKNEDLIKLKSNLKSKNNFSISVLSSEHKDTYSANVSKILLYDDIDGCYKYYLYSDENYIDVDLNLLIKYILSLLTC